MADENRFNTELRRGDSWTFVVTWRPDGEAINLAGYSAEFEIAWQGSYSPASGRIAAGSVTSEPDIDPAGVVTVALTAAETLTIPKVGEAAYQLRMTRFDGHKATIAVGNLAILQDYIDA